MLKTFKKGGIHPHDHKEFTNKKSIEIMPIPQSVVIPVVQHTGAPCTPTVKVGDSVKVGDLIASSDKPVSSPVHSSISGKVKKIDFFPHSFGTKIMSIQIESDGQDLWNESILKPESIKETFNPVKEKKDEYLKKIKDAGIAGMGGAAFPAHIKLSPPKDKKIDTLVLNGAECEPYLTADHRIMLEKAKEVITGARIMMVILGVNSCKIGIEANKPDAIESIQNEAKPYPEIEVVPLKMKYPQGGEKQLIRSVLGREVPSEKLPFHVGVVVQNVGTCAAVYDAVVLNKPLIERVLTVTGSAISAPKNLLVRIGSSFQEVLNYCGFKSEDGIKILHGGPMMGKTQWSLDVTIIKGTSGIVALDKKDSAKEIIHPCLRCGKCVQVCPMGLMACELALQVEKNIYDKLIISGLMDCMECGCCGYICPSRRPLVHWIRLGKHEINQIRIREREKAEKDKQEALSSGPVKHS